jgi:hypothetical protein
MAIVLALTVAVTGDGVPPENAPTSEQFHIVNIIVIDTDLSLISWMAVHGDSFGSRVSLRSCAG